MQVLLALIGLIALVGLVIGVIIPKWGLFFLSSERRTRGKAVSVYLIVLFFAFTGIGIIEPDANTEYDDDLTQKADQSKSDSTERLPLSTMTQKATQEQIENDRAQVRELLAELDNFKSNTKFHAYGYGAGFPYGHEWQKTVKALGATMSLEKGHSLALASSTSYLWELGHEYMNTKGRENKTTKTMRMYIEEGINPAPSPVKALEGHGEKEFLGKWASTWGISHQQEFIRQGDAATCISRFEDGSSSSDDYVAEDVAKGIKLTRVGDTFGEYYIINKQGELEYWSKIEKYYTAKPVQ